MIRFIHYTDDDDDGLLFKTRRRSKTRRETLFNISEEVLFRRSISEVETLPNIARTFVISTSSALLGSGDDDPASLAGNKFKNPKNKSEMGSKNFRGAATDNEERIVNINLAAAVGFVIISPLAITEASEPRV